MIDFFRKKNGLVTVFVISMLIPVLAVCGTLVDLAKMRFYDAQAMMVADAYAEAILSEYDNYLKEMYGIYAISQDSNAENEMTQFAAGVVTTFDPTLKIDYGKSDSAIDDLLALGSKIKQNFFSKDEKYNTINYFMPYRNANAVIERSIVTNASLDNNNVLETQIADFMKYRLAEVVLEDFEWFDTVKDIQEMAEAKDEIDKIVEASKTDYDELVRLIAEFYSYMKDVTYENYRSEQGKHKVLLTSPAANTLLLYFDAIKDIIDSDQFKYCRQHGPEIESAIKKIQEDYKDCDILDNYGDLHIITEYKELKTALANKKKEYDDRVGVLQDEIKTINEVYIPEHEALGKELKDLNEELKVLNAEYKCLTATYEELKTKYEESKTEYESAKAYYDKLEKEKAKKKTKDAAKKEMDNAESAMKQAKDAMDNAETAKNNKSSEMNDLERYEINPKTKHYNLLDENIKTLNDKKKEEKYKRTTSEKIDKALESADLSKNENNLKTICQFNTYKAYIMNDGRYGLNDEWSYEEIKGLVTSIDSKNDLKTAIDDYGFYENNFTEMRDRVERIEELIEKLNETVGNFQGKDNKYTNYADDETEALKALSSLKGKFKEAYTELDEKVLPNLKHNKNETNTRKSELEYHWGAITDVLDCQTVEDRYLTINEGVKKDLVNLETTTVWDQQVSWIDWNKWDSNGDAKQLLDVLATAEKDKETNELIKKEFSVGYIEDGIYKDVYNEEELKKEEGKSEAVKKETDESEDKQKSNEHRAKEAVAETSTPARDYPERMENGNAETGSSFLELIGEVGKWIEGLDSKSTQDSAAVPVDKILTVSYVRHMFSSRVTGLPKEKEDEVTGEDNVPEEENDDDKKEYSLTDKALSPDINYLYGAEVEYLIGGSKTSSINLEYTRNKVLAVRLLCNFFSTYTVTDISNAISSVASAAAAAAGIFAPLVRILVSFALRMAVAVARTAKDWEMLKNRKGVIFFYNKAKEFLDGIDDWIPEKIKERMSGGTSNNTADDDKKLRLGYEDYVHLLLYLVPTGKLISRTGKLIELNCNHADLLAQTGKGLDEWLKDSNNNPDTLFRLSKAYTAVKATCKVKVDFLILPNVIKSKGFLDTEIDDLLEEENKNYYGYSVVRGY